MIASELIKTYYERFVNRPDVWFQQWIDGEGKCQYACRKVGGKRYEPVTSQLIQKHLAGMITASFPATNQQGLSKWCCWDSDTDTGDLEKVENVLSSWGLSSFREARRAGRAGHLWMFFDEPLPATDLIRFNKEVLAHGQVRLDAIEFFPKTANGLSQVRGPLGIHRKPGADNARGWFEGPEQDVEAQLRWLVQQPLNSANQIQRLVIALRAVDMNSVYPLSKPSMMSRYQTGSKINVLELLPDARRIGSGFMAQCPNCAIYGRDTHKDNLKISIDGMKFNCVEGGTSKVSPGKTCTTVDVLNALNIYKG